MGAFFITNSNNEEHTKNIISIHRKKTITKSHTLTPPGFKIIYFEKKHVDTSKHIYKKNDDFIIGIGVFSYKELWAGEALAQILEDFTKDGNTVFNSVRGHFNFILYSKAELNLITDKTGTYHSFSSKENESFYISNSLISVASCLKNININNQAAFEFISSETTIRETIINEVNYNEFGSVINLSKDLQTTKYFQEESAKEEVSIESITNDIREYFKIFKSSPFSISADLSAGFDSRLSCAALESINANFTYNSNANSEDSSDLKFATEIANMKKKNIYAYTKDLENKDYSQLVFQNCDLFEISRNIFRGAYAPIFTNDKAKDFNMIIGGFGGELYRDVKYNNIKNLNGIIKKNFNDPSFKIKTSSTLKSQLKNKIKQLLNKKGPSNITSKEDAEKTYYFLKMMYWAGSRITYYNQYCYRIHPLLDYELIYKLFSIDDSVKANAKLQMKVIEELDYELASFESNYGYNFIWDPKKNYESQHTTSLKEKIKTLIKKIYSPYRKKKYPSYLQDQFLNEVLQGSYNKIWDNFPFKKNVHLSASAYGRKKSIELIFKRIKELSHDQKI